MPARRMKQKTKTCRKAVKAPMARKSNATNKLLREFDEKINALLAQPDGVEHVRGLLGSLKNSVEIPGGTFREWSKRYVSLGFANSVLENAGSKPITLQELNAAYSRFKQAYKQRKG